MPGRCHLELRSDDSATAAKMWATAEGSKGYSVPHALNSPSSESEIIAASFCR